MCRAGRCRVEDVRRHISLRLTDEALCLLSQLGARDGISRTAVLEVAIREAARARGVGTQDRKSLLEVLETDAEGEH